MFGLGTQTRTPKVIFLSYSWSYFFHIIFLFVYIPGLGPLSIPQSLKTLETQFHDIATGLLVPVTGKIDCP